MNKKERIAIIEREIKDLRVYYRSRWHLRGYKGINHGFCEAFAEDLKERLTRLNIVDIEIINSDAMKLNPDNGDYSDWSSDKVLEFNMRHPKNIEYDELNKLRLGYHVWIYDKITKRHYDSEAPKGVSCLFKLPIYNRAIQKYLSFNSLIEELASLKELMDCQENS